MRLLRDARIDGILLSSETATPSLSYFSTSVWVHPAGRLRAVWEEAVLCHAHNPLAHTAFLTMTRTRTSSPPLLSRDIHTKGKKKKKNHFSISHADKNPKRKKPSRWPRSTSPSVAVSVQREKVISTLYDMITITVGGFYLGTSTAAATRTIYRKSVFCGRPASQPETLLLLSLLRIK